MAVNDFSGLTIANPQVGIQITKVTDSSADWASVANSTYFYDKGDKLPHFKDANGNVNDIFNETDVIQAAASDEVTNLTSGTAKVTFRMPYAMTLTAVRASLSTAQTAGALLTVDINLNGTSVLGTKLTFDNTEKTTVTAATPATITTSALTDDGEITVDIDAIGTAGARGLKITLIGTRA